MRDISHINDLGTLSPGTGRVRARKRAGWQGPALASFPRPGDPALISLPERAPARHMVNLPSSIVKIRFWPPGRSVPAGLRKMGSSAGTDGSNPLPSCGESYKFDQDC